MRKRPSISWTAHPWAGGRSQYVAHARVVSALRKCALELIDHDTIAGGPVAPGVGTADAGHVADQEVEVGRDPGPGHDLTRGRHRVHNQNPLPVKEKRESWTGRLMPRMTDWRVPPKTCRKSETRTGRAALVGFTLFLCLLSYVFHPFPHQ